MNRSSDGRWQAALPWGGSEEQVITLELENKPQLVIFIPVSRWTVRWWALAFIDHGRATANAVIKAQTHVIDKEQATYCR